MEKHWFDEAWDGYLYWQSQDKKTLNKINRLLKDIERNGVQAAGKIEKLKYRDGWSCRIDQKNRLIFTIENDCLYIFSCKGHYDDH